MSRRSTRRAHGELLDEYRSGRNGGAQPPSGIMPTPFPRSTGAPPHISRD
jgi:hypothetical protein